VRCLAPIVRQLQTLDYEIGMSDGAIMGEDGRDSRRSIHVPGMVS
jgi:hypothetical protein